MAGLGSFVEGFTGGVNQRQAWDDRKRSIKLEEEDRKWLAENRDWARGDRQYTVEERKRLRDEQDRQLAEQQAERDAAAAAWAATQGAGGSPEQGRSLPQGAGGDTPLSFGSSVPPVGDAMMPSGARSLPVSTGVPGPAGGPPVGAAPPVQPQTQAPVVPQTQGPAGGPAPAGPRDWNAQPLTVQEWNAMPPEQRKSVPGEELSRAIAAMATERDASKADLAQRQAENSRLFTEVMGAEDAQARAANGLAPRSLPGIGAAPPQQPVAATAAPGPATGQVAPSAPAADMPAITGRPDPAAQPSIAMPAKGRAVLNFNSPAAIAPEVAAKSVKSTLQQYAEVGVPKMIEHYLKTGQVDKAAAMDAWAKDSKTKASMESWVKTVHSLAIGDEAGTLDNFAEYWSGMGLGVTVDRKASRLTRDEKGNVTGVEVAYTDREGKRHIQHFDGMEDMIQEGIMANDPATVWSMIYEQQNAAMAAQGKAQALEASIQIAIIRSQASGTAADPKRIAAAAKILSENSFGEFDKLPVDERAQKILDSLAAEDYALSIREGAETGAMGAPPVMYGP